MHLKLLKALTILSQQREFFAAPFLGPNFQVWAKQHERDIAPISSAIQEALAIENEFVGLSKQHPNLKKNIRSSFAHETYQNLLAYQQALVGNAQTQEPGLLNDNYRPIKALLKKNPRLLDVILNLEPSDLIGQWYQANPSAHALQQKRLTASDKSAVHLKGAIMPYVVNIEALAFSDNEFLLDLKTKQWAQSVNDKKKGFEQLLKDGTRDLGFNDRSFRGELTESEKNDYIADKNASEITGRFKQFIDNLSYEFQ